MVFYKIIDWQSGVSAEGRQEQQGLIMRQLDSILKGCSKSLRPAGAGVKLASDTEKEYLKIQKTR